MNTIEIVGTIKSQAQASKSALIRKFNKAFGWTFSEAADLDAMKAMRDYAEVSGRKDIAGEFDYLANPPADEPIGKTAWMPR